MMIVKKILTILGATLFLSTPAYAGYAFCQTYDRHLDIAKHYFSAVFHTTESHDVTLNTRFGTKFAAVYNTERGVRGNCTYRRTEDEALKARASVMREKGRWNGNKPVVLTDWTPTKEAKEVGGVWKDKGTGLIWQDVELVRRNWQEAKNYCSELNLSGYSDWFLPSKEQLFSLYKNKLQLKNNLPDYFWSSTESKSDSSNAWYVHFYDRGTNNYSKSISPYVRCVRVGQ